MFFMIFKKRVLCLFFFIGLLVKIRQIRHFNNCSIKLTGKNLLIENCLRKSGSSTHFQ